MIIRRKHTANFTTIGNALFNDERLEADEVGVIAGLLSKPHDWEVRRPQLQKRWRIGRDSIKRIIHSGMRTGWIIACKTRLANGTFHIIYEVRDIPGPELSDEEIKAALSVVSTGAGPDESDDDDGSDGTESEHPPPTENPSWSAGQPGLAEPSTVNPSRSSKSLQSTDSQRIDSTKCGRGFSDLKGQWPTDHMLSETASQTAFLALSDTDKEAAFHGTAAYLEDCKKQNRKVCDLTTFIRERRWERFQKTASSTEIAVIKPHTPEFFRWREYRVAIGDHEGLKAMDVMVKLGRDITVPSRWPPSIPKSPTDPPKESSAA